MAEKSNVTVLALDVADPSTSEGIIRVCKNLVGYLPSLPNGQKQKTPVFGDQGYFEKGNIHIQHDFLMSFWTLGYNASTYDRTS